MLRHLSHPVEAVVIVCRYVVHGVRLAAYGRSMRRRNARRILGVVPHTPLPLYTLWGVAQVLGLTLVPYPSKKTMLFIDLTKLSKAMLPDGAAKWLNGTCTDISKTRISNSFSSVTGRCLEVDPRTHEGVMVEKPEENGLHNGRLVHGPLAHPKRGQTYQRLIDNTNGEGTFVEDLRTVIVGGQIPLVYRKRRHVSRRFEGGSVATSLADPRDIFSEEELRSILSVSRAVGLDFGELDVLRDKTSGEIYVVDANKTSISPPISLAFRERVDALKIVAAAFETEFLGAERYTS